MKILLVDDESNILRTLSLCLSFAGYTVITATDGITAVELTFDQSPDLILLDLVLPKMNGYLVLETLRADERTKQIPVIIISAKAQEYEISKALASGAQDYLVKPFNPHQLLGSIEKQIGGHVNESDSLSRG